MKPNEPSAPEVSERKFTLIHNAEYATVYRCDACQTEIKQTPATADVLSEHVCPSPSNLDRCTFDEVGDAPAERYRNERNAVPQSEAQHEFREGMSPDKCGVAMPSWLACGQPRSAPIHQVPPAPAEEPLTAIIDLFDLFEQGQDGRWCFLSLSRDAARLDKIMDRLFAWKERMEHGTSR